MNTRLAVRPLPAPNGSHPGHDRPGPPAPRRPVQPDPTASPAASLLLAASALALTLAAAWSLSRVFTDRAWIAPVMLTAVVAHGASAVLRRHLPGPAALVVGLALVALLGIWTVLGSSTVAGVPLGATWRHVASDLARADTDLPAIVTPLHTTAGFLLVAVWGTGIVAVLCDWGTFRLRSALQGAAPALALFVAGSAAGGPHGRTTSVAVFVGAAVAYLLVHRATPWRGDVAWFAGRTSDWRGAAIGAGVIAGVVALLASVVVVPALPRRDGTGVLGWNGGPGGQGGTRSVISPIVDLRTRLVQQTDTPVFTVRSPVPSYWRLTTLDTFTGSLWESTDSYQAVGHRLPGVGTPPKGTRVVVQHFRIQNLDSIWLPAAFDPQAVRGGGRVTYDPVSGSLLSPRATSNNLVYRVTSLQQLATLDATKLRAAGPLPKGAGLAHDLQLPPSVPASVRSLALRVTAGRKTEYGQALALQNYLLGPLFTYSLDPPTDGYGISALTTFLFTTRTGYCQQFAGAYAVMARSIGLPTRLAVGFATGTDTGGGNYQVTDGDAHTWPEVYFPRYGWVPFEPTKGANFTLPGSGGYRGTIASGPVVPTSPTTIPATVPSGPAPPAALAPSSHLRLPAPASTGVPTVATPGHPVSPWWWLLAVLPGGAGLWVAATAAGRRWRWHRRRRGAEGQDRATILARWEETAELLQWWHLPRGSGETLSEYARRIDKRLHLVLTMGRSGHHGDDSAPPRIHPGAESGPVRMPAREAPRWGGIAAPARRGGEASPSREPTTGCSPLESLARSADAARYGEAEPGRQEVTVVAAQASGVAAALRAGAPLRLRLRWRLDIRLAWSGGSDPLEATPEGRSRPLSAPYRRYRVCRRRAYRQPRGI